MRPALCKPFALPLIRGYALLCPPPTTIGIFLAAVTCLIKPLYFIINGSYGVTVSSQLFLFVMSVLINQVLYIAKSKWPITSTSSPNKKSLL
jgi:hypothetical protein